MFRHHLKRRNEAKRLTKYEDQVDNYLCEAGYIKNMWKLLVSTLRFETNGDNGVKSFIAPARANTSKLYIWLLVEEKRPPFTENPTLALNHEHMQQNLCDLCIDWSTIGHCFTLFFRSTMTGISMTMSGSSKDDNIIIRCIFFDCTWLQYAHVLYLPF